MKPRPDTGRLARADLLARASKAAAKGDRKTAIASYRKLLEQDPGDDLALTRLGDLLAQTDQLSEARDVFLGAARNFEKRGFDDKALAVYALAQKRLPHDIDFAYLAADKHVARRRNAEAVKILLATRARHRRGEAIGLLRRVLEIDPFNFEVTLDLAQLVGRAEAKPMLERLAEGKTGRQLRRVRGAQLRVSPSPAALWRWLGALIAGR